MNPYADNQTKEAFMDAWAINGKPDDAYREHSRCCTGQVETLDLFNTAFRSGTDTTQLVATTHEAGYNTGHQDGERHGIVTVLEAIIDPNCKADLAELFPRQWAAATCNVATKDGDGS